MPVVARFLGVLLETAPEARREVKDQRGLKIQKKHQAQHHEGHHGQQVGAEAMGSLAAAHVRRPVSGGWLGSGAL